MGSEISIAFEVELPIVNRPALIKFRFDCRILRFARSVKLPRLMREPFVLIETLPLDVALTPGPSRSIVFDVRIISPPCVIKPAFRKIPFAEFVAVPEILIDPVPPAEAVNEASPTEVPLYQESPDNIIEPLFVATPPPDSQIPRSELLLKGLHPVMETEPFPPVVRKSPEVLIPLPPLSPDLPLS